MRRSVNQTSARWPTSPTGALVTQGYLGQDGPDSMAPGQYAVPS